MKRFTYSYTVLQLIMKVMYRAFCTPENNPEVEESPDHFFVCLSGSVPTLQRREMTTGQPGHTFPQSGV
ncbi:MAG: hypothetical protein R3B93_18965 [Bacteroidia bacterium]